MLITQIDLMTKIKNIGFLDGLNNELFIETIIILC